MRNGIPHRTEDKANRFVGFSRSSCSHSVSLFCPKKQTVPKKWPGGGRGRRNMFFFLSCLAVIHKEQRPRIRGSASPALFSVCVLWRSPIVGRPASCSPNENDMIVVKHVNPCRRERMEVKAVRKWVCRKKRRYCDMRHT